jgi:hypothetical protein
MGLLLLLININFLSPKDRQIYQDKIFYNLNKLIAIFAQIKGLLCIDLYLPFRVIIF